MAFINEIIPEEQKDKFNFPVQVSRNGRKPTLYKWVIDHEKGFYLVTASIEGGTYSGTMEDHTFYFHAYGEDVFIRAIPFGHSYTKDKKMTFLWKIIELNIPLILRSHQESLVELIVQAFKVWGYLADGDSFSRVDVEILCDISRDHNKEVK